MNIAIIVNIILGIHSAKLTGIGVLTAKTFAILSRKTKTKASPIPLTRCIPVPPFIFLELIQTPIITKIKIEKGLEVRLISSSSYMFICSEPPDRKSVV